MEDGKIKRTALMSAYLRGYHAVHDMPKIFDDFLAELGWELPANLHFIPVDFTKEKLDTALMRSSYDPKALSFCSWLGVIHYLPRDAVFTTLRTIAGICPAGSVVTFDYWDTDAFVAGKAAKRVELMQDMVRRAGEPMLTGLNPITLTEELQSVGLHLQEQLSPTHIQERYFQGRADGYYAYEHAYFARAAVE